MRYLAAVIVLMLLASCGPSAGDEALAELAVSMRAQTDMVQRDEGLHLIFEDCTKDCAGHRAGYLWALSQEDLIHEDDCPSQVNHSFHHGCQMGVTAAAFE